MQCAKSQAVFFRSYTAPKMRHWDTLDSFMLLCCCAMFAAIFDALALHFGISAQVLRTDALAAAGFMAVGLAASALRRQ
jgi:hypothetical protein